MAPHSFQQYYILIMTTYDFPRHQIQQLFQIFKRNVSPIIRNAINRHTIMASSRFQEQS